MLENNNIPLISLKSNFETRIKIKTINFRNLNKSDKLMVGKLGMICQLSPANKKKVGCIIAYPAKSEIISIGYNKMFDNLSSQDCEDEFGITIPYVTHAEENAVFAYLKSTTKKIYKSEDLTIYVSYAPCHNCSKIIAHMGITRIVYVEKHEWKFDTGPHSPAMFLHKMGIEVIQVNNMPTGAKTIYTTNK